jgi:alpha-mannosidase
MPDLSSSPIRVVVTPLVTRAQPTASRLIEIYFPIAGTPRAAHARVTVGDHPIEQDLGMIPPAEDRVQILVPEVTEPVSGTVELTLEQESWSIPLVITPARPWTVYLVHHSHIDLGFTHRISEVAAIQNENLDEAIELCEMTRDWPEGLRFKWTCELAWSVHNYVRSRAPAQIDRLRECLRRREIEVAAVYTGLHTDICGHEELVRSVYYAAQLRREWQIPINTAMINDVPGVTWAYAQVLAKSGIRYLIVADNNFLAPFLYRTDLPRPFYWQAPDGSRVLTWYTDDPYWAYVEGYQYGFDKSYRHVLRTLPAKLVRLEESDYPYDAFQIQIACDNFRVLFRPAHIARQWQENWANPRLVVATAHEFLAHMEENHAGDLSTHSGDWSEWWTWTIPTFPHETALSRQATEMLTRAEIIGTWALDAGAMDSDQYPHTLIREGYENLLVFDEHSGGGGLWQPKSQEEQWRAQYEGYAFPHQAAATAAKALEKVTFSLAGSLHNESEQHALVALNSLSWTRTDRAEVLLPEGVEEPSTVLDPDSGEHLPCQRLDAGQIAFIATDVPATGYKTFYIAPNGSSALAGDVTAGPRSLENEFYRLEVNEQGKIVHLIDKGLEWDMTAPAEPYGFGEFLWYRPAPERTFAAGENLHQYTGLYEGEAVPGDVIRPTEQPVQIEAGMSGPVSASLTIQQDLDNLLHMTQTIRLHTKLKRIDLDYVLTPKPGAGSVEERLGYIVFPFQVEEPQFRLEIPAALLIPEEEQFKGACRDFLAAQHWVGIYNQQHTALLSSLDAPVLELGRSVPSYRKFLPRWEAESSILWARLLHVSTRRMMTDSPYSVGKPLRVRFSVSGHAGSLEPVKAMQHGWGVLNPLSASTLKPGQQGMLPADCQAWCHIVPDNVLLVTAKPAEDGNGIIFRLWEAAGQACEVTLTLPHRIQPFTAQQTSLVEENQQRLEVIQNSVRFAISAFGIATIRISE